MRLCNNSMSVYIEDDFAGKSYSQVTNATSSVQDNTAAAILIVNLSILKIVKGLDLTQTQMILKCFRRL